MRSLVYLCAALAALTPAAVRAQESDFPRWNEMLRVASPGASYLGVNLREIDADRAKELRLKEEAGVEITRVEDDSPASRAGLKVTDVVLAYNGARVEGMEQFSRFVRETPAGRDVKLTIIRDGAVQTLTARLAARRTPLAMAIPTVPIPQIELPAMPAMPDLPRTVMMWRTAMLGVEVETLRGQLADFFGVKEGVLIRSVNKDSAAAKAGLKAGDVIIKVGDTKVTNPAEVTAAVRSAKDRKSVAVEVVRDHKEMTVTAQFDEERRDGEAPRPARARSLRM